MVPLPPPPSAEPTATPTSAGQPRHFHDIEPALRDAVFDEQRESPALRAGLCCYASPAPAAAPAVLSRPMREKAPRLSAPRAFTCRMYLSPHGRGITGRRVTPARQYRRSAVEQAFVVGESLMSNTELTGLNNGVVTENT